MTSSILRFLWKTFDNYDTYIFSKYGIISTLAIPILKAVSMAKKETPLMKQYNTIKAKYPDALLLFRVGDFYETFGEDAIRAAGILNITLTARNNGGEHVELAGFPHHSLNTYLPKLVMGSRVSCHCFSSALDR